MALVAKMRAVKVTKDGNGRLIGVVAPKGTREELEEQGIYSVAVAFRSYAYGIPPWFDGITHVRHEPNIQSAEGIELTAVSAKDEDDPNRTWAIATPTGHLTMIIQNPQAFGYVQPGHEYRVTIERIRGPQESAED